MTDNSFRINRAQVSGEFTEHAEEERGHALQVAERISQLGGDPGFDPATLAEEEEHANDIPGLLGPDGT